MQMFGLVNIPLWLLLSIVTTVVLYLVYMSWYFTTFKDMGIDGPKPTVVFGNLMVFMKEGVVKAQRAMYKKYGRVFGWFEGRTPNLVIGDPKMLRSILIKDFNHFTNRKKFVFVDDKMDYMLTRLKDNHWRFVRQSITPTFSGKKLRLMTPLIIDAADLMMKILERNVQTDNNVELKTLFGGYSMDVIGRTGFGLEVDSQTNPNNPFIKYAKSLTSARLIGVFLAVNSFFPFMSWLLPFLQKLGLNLTKEATDFFFKTTKDALKVRKENPGRYNDFLEIMLNAQAEEENQTGKAQDGTVKGESLTRKHLTTDELMAQALLFFMAGYDTVSNTLLFVMYHLAIYPETCEKSLQEVDEKLKGETPTYDTVQDLPYMDMCINETMRIFPAAELIDRDASSDVTIENIVIPKGMTVTIPIGSIHMDPEFWPDPTKFDPERFTPEAKAKRDPLVFLPFGAGPRNCIGMKLALIEAKIALVRILQKYKPVRSEKTEVPFKVSKMGNRPTDKGLWVKFERRT